MQSLAGKRVLVLGLGISGRSAAAWCAERGARVTAADERPAEKLAGALPPGVEPWLGRSFPDPAAFDLVVPSPGVPPERYRSRATRVCGDIELAADALAVPIVAVTGTNGKSTTTALVTQMLRAAGLRAEMAGNVGTPALSLVGQPLDAAVLEVSSFQLETTESFRPAVAVVLNATPDHLDRHHTMEAYVAAKARILANQRAEDWAVLNEADEWYAHFRDAARGRVLPFRAIGVPAHGAGVDAGSLVIRREDGAPALRFAFDWREPGVHNRENAVAAAAAVFALGVPLARALAALPAFRPLPHRTELVAQARGITWVDDSKATNPGAALRALEGFSQPIIWIAGGRAKGLDLAPLAAAARARVRAAVLIGEAAAQLEQGLRGGPLVHREANIEDAVRRAAEIAREGDVVLLAPGCSSHDQFANFEERGRRFREAARAQATQGREAAGARQVSRSEPPASEGHQVGEAERSVGPREGGAR
jgi:UDP-N-acetylmuramoylalanine--D-glutamate ligase